MVVITSPGDSGLDEDMIIEKSELNEINKEIKAEGKKLQNIGRQFLQLLNLY